MSDVASAIREVERRAKKPVVQATQTLDDAFPHLSIPETLTLLLVEQRRTNELLNNLVDVANLIVIKASSTDFKFEEE